MSEKKSLGKGRMMLLIISRALKKGVAPEEVEETLGRRGLFQALDGKLGTEEIQKKLKAKDPGNLARFFYQRNRHDSLRRRNIRFEFPVGENIRNLT